jgi:hypothetical protein
MTKNLLWAFPNFAVKDGSNELAYGRFGATSAVTAGFGIHSAQNFSIFPKSQLMNS